MSDGYTTTDEIRAAYFVSKTGLHVSAMSHYPEFDHWIAEVVRQAKAEAWDEGYQEANQDLWRDGGREGNPYSSRADGRR